MRMGLRSGSLIVSLAVLLTACDTLTEPEPVVLDAATTFEFRFTVSGSGAVGPVTSEEAADIGSQLEGFAKGEILAAEVTSVEIRRIQPVGQTLADLLTGAEVQVTTSGTDAATIATATSFPAQTRASLPPQAGVDVGRFLRASQFRARFVPQGLPSGEYVFETSLEFRIEVEGL